MANKLYKNKTFHRLYNASFIHDATATTFKEQNHFKTPKKPVKTPTPPHNIIFSGYIPGKK